MLSRSTIHEDLDIHHLRPIDDYVLIEVLKKEKTAGGIILPKGENDSNCIGRVIASSGTTHNKCTGRQRDYHIYPGDVVLCMGYMGEKVQTIHGDDSTKLYKLVREHGIWAKLHLDYNESETLKIKAVDLRYDHMLVKPDEEEMTRGGLLYLPFGNRESKVRVGTISQVGPGRYMEKLDKNLPMELKSGDQVIFMRYAGAELIVAGEQYRLVCEDDIYAIMESGEPTLSLRGETWPNRDGS